MLNMKQRAEKRAQRYVWVMDSFTLDDYSVGDICLNNDGGREEILAINGKEVTVKDIGYAEFLEHFGKPTSLAIYTYQPYCEQTFRKVGHV